MDTHSLRLDPARTNAGRRGLLCLFIPLLLFAQLLGGRCALVHVHGSDGLHVHVLPEHAHDHGGHARAAWHAVQHGGDVAGFATEAALDEEAEGVLVQVPQSENVTVRTATGIAKSTLQRMTSPSVESDRVPGRDVRAKLAPVPRETRTVGSCRSGIAALLCSSHAILI